MRLIDADKLDWWYKGRNIRKVLDDAPTIDAVPVVRCRDCKEFNADDRVCYAFEAFVKEDDFCSYGERKDGDGK